MPSSSPLLSKLEWPTIDEIIKGETTNMVYKSINNLAPNIYAIHLLKAHLAILSL